MSVLMFHSVGSEKEPWYRQWLSVSSLHFETFCNYLATHNYETIFLDQWYANQQSSAKTNPKQVVITFDDGYLDNWVYAYPILQKYNLKGTIFVNPEFITEGSETRPTVAKLWDHSLNKDQIPSLGFLNWKELQVMQASGVMDIQSHTMSHNFYFSSNKILDIYTRQPQYDWLAWIEKPDRKPYYITEDQSQCIHNGYPIFEFDRALAVRRYFPDDQLVAYAKELFEADQDRDTMVRQLEEKLKAYPGRYESDDDMEKRYRYELFESKKILEEKLNKPVDFLCWPGGGYNDLGIQLSIEAGYKASTISKKGMANLANYDAQYKPIKRRAMTSFISTAKGDYYVNNADFLVTLFKRAQGNSFEKNRYRLKKLRLMILEQLGLIS